MGRVHIKMVCDQMTVLANLATARSVCSVPANPIEISTRIHFGQVPNMIYSECSLHFTHLLRQHFYITVNRLFIKGIPIHLPSDCEDKLFYIHCHLLQNGDPASVVQLTLFLTEQRVNEIFPECMPYKRPFTPLIHPRIVNLFEYYERLA